MTLLSSAYNRPSAQARAVLCYLDEYDGVEASRNDETKRYDAIVNFAEWHNGREHGYILSMRAPSFTGAQLNIAFFEHRNSDNICAIKWVQSGGINPLTIDTADFGGQCYKDKYDVSHSQPFGHAGQMAAWIHKELEEFWLAQVQSADAA